MYLPFLQFGSRANGGGGKKEEQGGGSVFKTIVVIVLLALLGGTVYRLMRKGRYIDSLDF